MRSAAESGSRIRESIQILEVSDPESLEVLAALNEEIAAWVDRFAPGT
ncbi:MAG: hypothetical protein HKN80_13010 [Acidimicrobiia bacterium]|nr:hypothetical protein [Acidimicrobiia bacterium]